MFCTKCGKPVSDNAKFCTGCGTRIDRSDSELPKMEPPKAEPPKAEKPQIEQPQVQQPQMSQPQIQPPQMQQPQMSQPQMQQPQAQQNISNVQESDMSSQRQETPKTKKDKNKKSGAVTALLVVLLVLVAVAIGMAVYYFMVLRDDDHSGIGKKEEVTEDRDMDDEQENVEEEDKSEVIASEPADSEAEDPEEAVNDAVEEQETEEETLSDTNEVVKDTVLSNIPKSVYSYDFDESLGNAQVVTRSEIETMPEIADGIEPQYVSGMDGKAVYLDGTYGIRLSDVQRVGSSYTVAFWMKADAFYDWAPFIHIGHDLLNSDQRSRLWLGQKTDGVSVAPIISSEQASLEVSYEIRPTGVYTSMQPGVWYYIVYSVDGTKQGSSANSVQGTLYVAGQYAGEGDIARDMMNVDNLDVYLGINCWDALYPVAFDSVKIWDQALDANQVKELFNAY